MPETTLNGGPDRSDSSERPGAILQDRERDGEDPKEEAENDEEEE